jgi:hypothetical protein
MRVIGASRPPILAAAIWLVCGEPVFGQGVSVSFENDPIRESSKIDGTVLVHEVRGADGLIRVERVAAIDIDFRAIERQNGPGIAALSFRCRTPYSCVDTTTTFGSASRAAGQTVTGKAPTMDLRCRLADCDRLLAGLRSAAGLEGTPAERNWDLGVRNPIDCAALRSTYTASGQRLELPPECQNDLDRATTYRPGTPSAPAAVPTEEIVIDGSKIPSQIDFTRPASSPSTLPPAAGSDANEMTESGAAAPPVAPAPAPTATPTTTGSPALPGADATTPSIDFAPQRMTPAEVFGNGLRGLRDNFRATATAVREWISTNFADLSAWAVDTWRDWRFGPDSQDFSWEPIQARKLLVQDWVYGQADKLWRNFASRRTESAWEGLGVDAERHKELFEKDAEVVDSVLDQLPGPANQARTGQRMVDAAGDLLGLGEQ